MRIIELKVMISCFLIAHDEKALSLSLFIFDRSSSSFFVEFSYYYFPYQIILTLIRVYYESELSIKFATLKLRTNISKMLIRF